MIRNPHFHTLLLCVAAAVFLMSLRFEHVGPPSVTDHTQRLITEIGNSVDPATARIQQLISKTLPPGWENTFVLHDALVVSASLTECARLVSFASSSDLAHAPRKALSGEALEFHQKLEGFALRWMLAKHPGLGEPAIREIVSANNHHLLPMLGPYNLLKGPGLVETLGIPMVPPQPPTEFVLPEGIRRMQELQRTPTPRR
jgi:hypothetical protein